MSGVLAGIAAQKQHQQQRMFHGLRSTNELDPGPSVALFIQPALIRSQGMPHDSPCLSFWLGQARHSEILGLRTTTELPKEQDVVISKLSAGNLKCSHFSISRIWSQRRGHGLFLAHGREATVKRNSLGIQRNLSRCNRKVRRLSILFEQN